MGDEAGIALCLFMGLWALVPGVAIAAGGSFNLTFYLLQVKLAAGAVKNTWAIGLNIRDGLRLTVRGRKKAGNTSTELRFAERENVPVNLMLNIAEMQSSPGFYDFSLCVVCSLRTLRSNFDRLHSW